MSAQVAIDGKTTPRIRRAMAWTAAVLVGGAIWSFLDHFYLVRERFVFVGIAALLVFVGANLVLIGMLVREAARGVRRYGRRAQPRIIPQEQLYVSSDLPH